MKTDPVHTLRGLRARAGLVSALLAWLMMATGLFALGVSEAQAEPFSQRDRDEIARLRQAQGWSAEAVNPLVEQANRASERGLPPEPFVNKIKEGLAKGVEPERIEPVLRNMMGNFETADEVLRDVGDHGGGQPAGGERDRALDVLAEALAHGVTPGEVREINRLSQQQRVKPSDEMLASGARSLALMKEAGIPVQEGLPLVNEAMRQGFRSTELVDLGREIKRHRRDFQDGGRRLESVREAIVRGERPERIFGN